MPGKSETVRFLILIFIFDFERFPFVELGLINAGKIGNGEKIAF
jgi:hypothetical protein